MTTENKPKKKFKIAWKKIFRIAYTLALIALFIVSAAMVQSRQEAVTCKSVNISIDESEGNFFVEQSDVLNTIHDKWGTLVGKPVVSINMNLLETLIDNNPYILRAEVFSTIDGGINIDIRQREPVLRIMNRDNQSFYIDKNGLYMPLSEKHASYVPVASGNIPDGYVDGSVNKIPNQKNDSAFNKSLMEQLYDLASFIRNDELWQAQIVQLYVNDEGDIEMIPRVGNHRIILGDTQNMEEKFSKLQQFYQKGLGATGWNNYNTINLKFSGQVVCTKN
jgi:cell division protein FtsQ